VWRERARSRADDIWMTPMPYFRTALCLAALLAWCAAAPLHAEGPSTSTSSRLAQNTPAAPAPAPPAATSPAAPAQGSETFVQDVTLTAKTIIYLNGNATWDSAFETLIDAFKQLNTYLERQGLKPDGPAMTIYTSTDDTGFSFQAAIPLAEEPQNPPRGDIAIGKSPAGHALKFVHHGSYDSMDTTYEAITNYLDEKRLEAKDLFIEEYATDPATTPEDQLVITVLVPIK
jgi:effector-binding domain-containing protein